MKSILKEPLVHFLLLGALLFAVYGLVDNDADQENVIIIDDYDMKNLIASWEMQWKRIPDQKELKNLVDQNLRQEIFYQEALKMNLDHNDEIIKRRLAQKMLFLSNDLASLKEPTDEELKAFFNEHSSDYELAPVFTLYQVVYGNDYHNDPNKIAEQRLKTLNNISPTDLTDKGDPLPFQFHYSEINAADLNRVFGTRFSDQLIDEEVRQWFGPVRSAYGSHLIFLEAKKAAEIPAFDAVKDQVKRDYAYYFQNQLNDQLYAELKKTYRIEFDLDPEKFDAEFVDFLKK